MALADMYKQNNVSYYENGAGFSGIFTDTLANLLANGDLDYSIFLNCGCDWSYLNTGCKGNHFSMYPDWVGGVLAIRQGPSTHNIKYVGSAVMSKTNTSAVFNVTKQLGDNSGFLNSRFLIDVIPGTYGADTSYNSFNYAAYTGQKYGFNSCILQSTSYYRTTDTAHTGTFISDYTVLTGDNARRLTAGVYQILATNYNPYLADSDTLDSIAIGYLYMFFEIDGELIACRNIPAMPNTAQWQSWFRYTEGGTDVYVTIGTYDNAVTVGSQGALPSSDDVKGIYCYNYNGTCQNCYSTKNAVSYIANCYGIRWMVGNTGLSTAGDWRHKVCLGVMSSDGIIDHDNWLVGESAIQASNNPNKNTDYDHIPSHGGGGGSTEDDYTDMDLGVSNVTLGGLTKYAILSKSELIGLIADYNGNSAMAGSNFSNHIICLYRLGFPASSIATTTTGNIVMVRSAGDVDFISQANTYKLITKQTVFIDAGGIKVPRMTNTFYDFSPYSTYELYIPGCGWIPLPDNVADRNIHVYIVFDLPTCSAKGIVRIAGSIYGGTTIATVNGIIGASCPFTIGENGQQRAAVMSANAQVAAGIATGIVGATINPMMAVAGGAELLSGLIGAYTAGNTNYVSTKGGAADFSMFGDGGRAVLKINSPVIDSVVNNSEFGHTVGYMCNETGQLNKFHGFTVCSNPHVHISATSTEKEEIKRLLEEGVILP